MRNYLFVFLSFFALTAHSQTIITDRPDQTESSSSVGDGVLQVESGVAIGFEGEEGQVGFRSILAPTTLFRYGLSETFELRLVNQLENTKFGEISRWGVSDWEIGFKIDLFHDPEVNTEVAFLSHLLMPNGSNVGSSGKFGTVNKLSISHAISESVGVGYNVGYNYFGEGNGDLTYSLALGVAVNDKVGVYIEPYGDIAEFDKHISNFDAGLTYLLNNKFQLDFSFGTGVNHRMNYLAVGFSWMTGK